MLGSTASLSEKLIYGTPVDTEALVDLIMRCEALDLVLENYNLSTIPDELAAELAALFPEN